MSRCCKEGCVNEDVARCFRKRPTYSVGNGTQHVVPEEVQYKVHNVIDGAVSVQLLWSLGLVLHGWLRPAREETLVVDDANEIAVHIAS